MVCDAVVAAAVVPGAPVVVAAAATGAATGAGAGAIGCSVLEFHRPDERGTIVVVSASCCLLESCCTEDLSHAAWNVGSAPKIRTRKKPEVSLYLHLHC